jgi:hypothetical protein
MVAEAGSDEAVILDPKDKAFPKDLDELERLIWGMVEKAVKKEDTP